MKQLLGFSFIIIAITMLIFFGMGSITELMGSANESLNSSTNPVLAQSFNSSVNITTSTFSILTNVPLLLTVILIIIVLFMFVGVAVTR